MKTVDCREGCGNKMEISQDSTSGMCWRCVNKMVTGPTGRLEYAPDDVLIDKSESTEEEDDGSVALPNESWND